MPPSNLSGIIESLRAEEARLEESVEQRRNELRVLTANLKCVQSSIVKLEKGPTPPKRALSDDEVATFVRGELQDDGAVERSVLRGLLLEHARAQGCSGTGIHLALARVLKRSTFDISDDGTTRLAEDRHAKVGGP